MLRSPWPLGIAIVVLSSVEFLTTPRHDEELLSLMGDLDDPGAVHTVGTVMVATVTLVPLASFLWLIFWKFPSDVRLFAWCKERSGRSLLWSLMLGGSGLFNLWEAATELGASQYVNAVCDLAWAGCMVLLRAVVVSRLAEQNRAAVHQRTAP